MSLGGARVQGELVIVDDPTGTPHDVTVNPASVDLALCAFAARGLYTVKPDVYDSLVVFTTHPMTEVQYTLFGKTPSGYAVRQTDQGITYGGFLIRQPPSAYGSAAELDHCAYMGPLRQWPANPDAPFELPAGPLGGTKPMGLTGVEVLGHEFGHHWLLFAAHDANDGRGLQALFRSDPRDPEQADRPKPSTADLHYSHLAGSLSVMFGNTVTPLGGDTFRLEGGARKYSPLDQYLMGLRGAHETPPLLVIDDGSQRGLIGTPLMAGQTELVRGRRVDIPVDDVIRAVGPRVPAYPNTQRCFRFAFVVVAHPGHTVTAAELATIEAYRQRWESWFPFATDGRGSVDTRLSPADPCPTTPVDLMPASEVGIATQPVPVEPLGTEPPPTPPVMMEPRPEPMQLDPELNSTLKPGCGCGIGNTSGLMMLALCCLLARPLRQRAWRHRR
ncbi:MAG: hypothetical protein JNK82_14850, partial [Myxococcaceae bacterium]|nr:hypothetical protein [Myxococcaceae bacterium]